MAWAKNGNPDTLTVAGDIVNITDLTAKNFNQFMFHDVTSGNTSHSLTFNNNSNTVYAHRSSLNGNADITQVNQPNIDEPNAFASDKFSIHYVISTSGEEKLGIQFISFANAPGAGNAPFRVEMVYKFVPSPDADITRIDFINDQTGDYAIGSNLSALGTN